MLEYILTAEELLMNNWHKVKINDYSYYSSIEMIRFCQTAFGVGTFEPSIEQVKENSNAVWFVFDWYETRNFYFMNAADATMFRLKWL